MSFVEPSEDLWSELSSLAQAEGLVLYDIERRAFGTLRVFIDRVATPRAEGDEAIEKAPERVTSEDCSRLCRRLMVFFSVEGARFGLGLEPEIEVSSPGVNRHLRLADHFSAAIGERVKVVLREEPAPGVGLSLSGVLKEAGQKELRVFEELKNAEVCFGVHTVKRAHVDYQFG